MALSGLGVVLGRVASEGLGVPVPAEVPERPQCLSYEYVTQLPQAAASRPPPRSVLDFLRAHHKS